MSVRTSKGNKREMSTGEAKVEYDKLLIELRKGGKPPTERDQRRLAYLGQKGGVNSDVISDAILGLGPNVQICADLPTPTTMPVTIPGNRSKRGRQPKPEKDRASTPESKSQKLAALV